MVCTKQISLKIWLYCVASIFPDWNLKFELFEFELFEVWLNRRFIVYRPPSCGANVTDLPINHLPGLLLILCVLTLRIKNSLLIHLLMNQIQLNLRLRMTCLINKLACPQHFQRKPTSIWPQISCYEPFWYGRTEGSFVIGSVHRMLWVRYHCFLFFKKKSELALRMAQRKWVTAHNAVRKLMTWMSGSDACHMQEQYY